VENSREAWEQALEETLREGWRRLADEQQAVHTLRHMDVVARECWLPALMRVRLPRPLSGRELKAPLGGLRKLKNALRYVVYSQDYLAMKRLQDSLPAWLLNLARRFY
jgi:hypothetical protein